MRKGPLLSAAGLSVSKDFKFQFVVLLDNAL